MFQILMHLVRLLPCSPQLVSGSIPWGRGTLVPASLTAQGALTTPLLQTAPKHPAHFSRQHPLLPCLCELITDNHLMLSLSPTQRTTPPAPSLWRTMSRYALQRPCGEKPVLTSTYVVLFGPRCRGHATSHSRSLHH